ncbi:MAG TPA: hypothetical protein P5526_28110 [Anaerolineae bacterium]|nr:hypothetical protein [Anaerolineae bacterium]MCB9108747.1 hypothetical protein [Anaerolineales bacterium]HRV96049.1 hypothetical protein [Anaerolineae bacterium]
MSDEGIIIRISRRDRTIVFPVNERDKLRELLKDRIWWDRRSNRWAGRGDVDELKEMLEEAGYTVKVTGG